MACSVDPRRAAAEKAVEKHMGGCMAGFLHFFDRHHLLSSKRLHHSPSSPPANPSPATPSPANVEEERMPATKQVPLPALDEGLVRSSWKLRDSPRLSLDSRVGANLRRPAPAELARHSEAAEKGRRGPGVVARLMGLDALSPAPEKKAELRRSASESRVSGRRLLDLEQQEKVSAPPMTAAAKRKEPTPRCQQQGRSFFDVFPPEPAKKTIAIPTELEKRLKLKLKWVDDHSTDLEALKQILEALKLKGLLHTPTASKAPEKKRNMVYDSTTPPSRSPRTPRARRPPAGDFSPPSSPHKCRRRNIISPHRKSSPATVSPRRRNLLASTPPPQADEESSTATTVSTMSDSNGSAQSYSDAGESGRGSMAECYYNEGRSLLERCDKLLHSIAEMTGNEQPSPVSVLDAGPFHLEEEEDGSPPPIPMKRCLLFHETGVDGGTSPERFSGDGDFFYVGEVLRAMEHCGGDGRRWSEVFAALERRMYAGGTKAARLNRRLLFDAVLEIAGRPSGWAPAATPKRVWTEVERLRRRAAPAGDVGEVVGGVLGKDMAAAGVWGCAREETAEAVLDVERLIFKDLVGEAIRDLAVAGELPPAKVLRRRLPF